MSKIITHSDNPNKLIAHPCHRKTWQCKCGTINEPEAAECKMILLLVKKLELAKSLRSTHRSNGISGEQRTRRREPKEASALIKAQVAEVDAWLLSPLID